MIWSLVPLAALAAVVLFLRSEVGPVLVHRPLVLGPLLGFVAGVPEAGFLLGAALEWVWVDRIPAGGLRTPAVSVGLAAALVGLAGMQGAAASPGPVPPGWLSLALVVALMYTVAFVPLDGSLRRLWNLTAENAILAVERGSTRELRALPWLALILRGLLTAGGLLAAAPIMRRMWRTAVAEGWSAELAFLPWSWSLPAAIAALSWRGRKYGLATAAVVAFLAGWGATWLP